MRDEYFNKIKLSWPRKLVRKWFNIKGKTEQFQSDESVCGGSYEWRASKSDWEHCTMKKIKTEKSTKGMEHPALGSVDLDRPQIINVHNYRFQEIVPLNAVNILGVEDNGPAKKWMALIGKTLNSGPGTSGGNGCYTSSPVPDPIAEWNADFEGSSDYSSCHRPSDHFSKWGSSDDDYGPADSPTASFSPVTNGVYAPMEGGYRMPKNSTYCLAASKQMGIFLTVWMRSDLREHVRNMKMSCVGRGLMGYLRNKGSISISMQLHQTSFCFVCSHLTSGQKKGDELRRNSDVMEILKKMRFPQVSGAGEEKSPSPRLFLNMTLVEMQNWRALLGNDQLRIEQRRGRVFVGWKEGKI